MAESLEFYDGEPGVCRIAGLRNVMILSWSARATGPAVAHISVATQRMIAAYPTGMSAVHLIANKAGVPTPEARSGLMKIMSEQSKHLACVGVVVGGSGFWASTMRSFVTGMRFMTPRNFDLRLHGTFEEILTWLPKEHTKVTGVPVDEVALARVLGSVETWPEENSMSLFSRTSRVG
jgi:hypothetical protein